jgi:hypothetical protein
MVSLTDLFESKEVMPDIVEIIFQGFSNPNDNIVTDSWKLRTYTWDNYLIDTLDDGLSINFYCEYPCATCDIL